MVQVLLLNKLIFSAHDSVCQPENWTPLQIAYSADQLHCVEKLDRLGVPLSGTDGRGNSLLHLAAPIGPDTIQVVAHTFSSFDRKAPLKCSTGKLFAVFAQQKQPGIQAGTQFPQR